MAKFVLIAEDDRFLGSAYKAAFQGSGFDVAVALDGNEALKIMRERSTDVLILDLLMPALDGFGVLTAMRKEANLSKVPVIVASNLGGEQDIEKAKSLGARDYIIKSETTINAVIEKAKALSG